MENSLKEKESGFKMRFRRTDIYKNWGRYILVLPAVFFIIVFAYVPMIGIIMAFENYDPIAGLFHSEWVGIENFKFFFKGSSSLSVTVNTLYLNAMFIVTGTIASLFIAVILCEIKKGAFLKISQTLMTLPNFISWATVALFSVAFLSSDGIINRLAELVGKHFDFSTDPGVWPITFIFIRIWKGAGWGAIIYMAAILGIDSEIYEAAKIDGITKIKSIFYITLPLIKGIIVLLFILSIGGIFRGDFGMIYPFIGDNALLFPTTDVIDTMVYRAVRTQTNYGKTTAIGLYQSVMGFALVIFANFMAKRYAPDSAIF